MTRLLAIVAVAAVLPRAIAGHTEPTRFVRHRIIRRSVACDSGGEWSLGQPTMTYWRHVHSSAPLASAAAVSAPFAAAKTSGGSFAGVEREGQR